MYLIAIPQPSGGFIPSEMERINPDKLYAGFSFNKLKE